MTRVLVVWEDELFRKLDLVLKKRVATNAPPGTSPTAFPEIISHTAYGNGGFKRYASSTWGRARAAGAPLNPGVIDHLICVVDGDKLHEYADFIPHPPTQAGAVGGWLVDAERAWQSYLRDLCDKAPTGTIHGLILCWCKESLVLAVYDQDVAKRHLGIDVQASEVQALLTACKPPPASVPNALFSSTFRKPLDCLSALARAQPSARSPALGKNAPEFDDALGNLTRGDLAVVARRVPDLDRLAGLIWRLAVPTASASAGGQAPAGVPALAGAVASKAKGAQRRAGVGPAAKASQTAKTGSTVKTPSRGASKPPAGKKRR